MEIAVPIMIAGGMYVISNSRKRRTQEGFTAPPSNYPNQPPSQGNYPSNADMTQKYLNWTAYETEANQGAPVGSNIQDIYTLSGDWVGADKSATHMSPFSGGKVRGGNYTNDGIAESRLDNMTGYGSQYRKKEEVGPLFNPEDNLAWTYGMPNQSDFNQSRVVPSMRVDGVAPIEKIQVGPGLNQGLDAVDGRAGFNSGLEYRDVWQDKTVNQLRVATNPKLTYELDGLEGPLAVQNKVPASRETFGHVNKKMPDTFFENTPNRWLTTTGESKGSALRPAQEIGNVRRITSGTEYSGPATSSDYKASYAPGRYEASRKAPPLEPRTTPSSAVGMGDHHGMQMAHDSHTTKGNCRSSNTQPETLRHGFSRTMGELMAPLTNLLKPTKKEEIIFNPRPYGLGLSTTTQGGICYDRETMAPSTIKETTLYTPYSYVNCQEGTYVNNLEPIPENNRNATNRDYYPAAASAVGNVDYSSTYRQTNNMLKPLTATAWAPGGGTQLFQPSPGVQCGPKDCTPGADGRFNPAFIKTSMSLPSTESIGRGNPSMQLDNTIHSERLDPSILDAFRRNPFTHSLCSTGELRK